MGAGLSLDFERALPSGFRLRAQLSLPVEPLVTVLFGPSGSGKTTLLRAVAGLDHPQTGTIRCGDEVWFNGGTGIAPQQRRIGYIPQDDSLFPHLTIRGNLLYPLSGPKAAARVDELLRTFELTDLADRRPAQVSGGQRQRAALARSLANRPRLLLLDEPLSALDVPTRERVRLELRRLLTALGIPAIVVTHDRTDALSLGDRMAVMIDGAIRQVAPVAEVFGHPADPDVARLVGVETILQGQCIGVERGLTRVRVGTIELVSVSPAAGSVLACIRAEDVILQRRPPESQSARNHLSAKVLWTREDGPMQRVGLDCGFPLVALVTRASVEDLELREGAHITAVIKAPAVHLIAR